MEEERNALDVEKRAKKEEIERKIKERVEQRHLSQ